MTDFKGIDRLRSAVESSDSKENFSISEVRKLGRDIDKDIADLAEQGKSEEIKKYLSEYSNELKAEKNMDVVQPVIKTAELTFRNHRAAENTIKLRNTILKDIDYLAKHHPDVANVVNVGLLTQESKTNSSARQAVMNGLKIIGSVNSEAMDALKFKALQDGKQIDENLIVHMQKLCAECSATDFGAKEIAAVTAFQGTFQSYFEEANRGAEAFQYGVDGVPGYRTISAILYVIQSLIQGLKDRDIDILSRKQLFTAKRVDIDFDTGTEVNSGAEVPKFRVMQKGDKLKYTNSYDRKLSDDELNKTMKPVELGDIVTDEKGNEYVLRKVGDDFECVEIPKPRKERIYDNNLDTYSDKSFVQIKRIPGQAELVYEYYDANGNIDASVKLDGSIKTKAIKETITPLPNGLVLLYNSGRQGQDLEGNNTQTPGRFEIHEVAVQNIDITTNVTDPNKLLTTLGRTLTAEGDNKETIAFTAQEKVIKVTNQPGGEIKMDDIANNEYGYLSRVRATTLGTDWRSPSEPSTLAGIKESKLSIKDGESKELVVNGIRYKVERAGININAEVLKPTEYTVDADPMLASMVSLSRATDVFVQPAASLSTTTGPRGETLRYSKADGTPFEHLGDYAIPLESEDGSVMMRKNETIKVVVDNRTGQPLEYTAKLSVEGTNAAAKITLKLDKSIPPKELNQENPEDSKIQERDIILKYFKDAGNNKLLLMDNQPKKFKIQKKYADWIERDNMALEHLEVDDKGVPSNFQTVDKAREQDYDTDIDNAINLIPDEKERMALKHLTLDQGAHILFLEVENGHVKTVVTDTLGDNPGKVIDDLPNLTKLGLKEGTIDLQDPRFHKITEIEILVDQKIGNIDKAIGGDFKINERKRKRFANKFLYENGVIVTEKGGKALEVSDEDSDLEDLKKELGVNETKNEKKEKVEPKEKKEDKKEEKKEEKKEKAPEEEKTLQKTDVSMAFINLDSEVESKPKSFDLTPEWAAKFQGKKYPIVSMNVKDGVPTSIQSVDLYQQELEGDVGSMIDLIQDNEQRMALRGATNVKFLQITNGLVTALVCDKLPRGQKSFDAIKDSIKVIGLAANPDNIVLSGASLEKIAITQDHNKRLGDAFNQAGHTFYNVKGDLRRGNSVSIQNGKVSVTKSK